MQMHRLSVNTEPLPRKRLLLWTHSLAVPGAVRYYRFARNGAARRTQFRAS
jgi:hypothetical protein